jgi:hypothetical protein
MRTLRHAKLGELQWEEEGWWQGEASVSGGELPFAIRGDKRGPDEPLATALIATLAKWPEVVKKAKTFLEGQGNDTSQLAVLSIVFLSTPTHFAIDLELDDEEEPESFTLEFEHGEPKHLSLDQE